MRAAAFAAEAIRDLVLTWAAVAAVFIALAAPPLWRFLNEPLSPPSSFQQPGAESPAPHPARPPRRPLGASSASRPHPSAPQPSVRPAVSFRKEAHLAW